MHLISTLRTELSLEMGKEEQLSPKRIRSVRPSIHKNDLNPIAFCISYADAPYILPSLSVVNSLRYCFLLESRSPNVPTAISRVI